MISWILGIILLIWCLVKRSGKGGKVEGQPLGMPRGTIRALNTILIVTFPFSYILSNLEIPSLIINAIFILVAFYFQLRKSGKESLRDIVKVYKNPEKKGITQKKEKFPLYLPRYTVRFSLIIILIAIIWTNFIGPQVPFEGTDTLIEILLIIGFYLIGSFFRRLRISREKARINKTIEKMEKTFTENEIVEMLKRQKPSWWKQKGMNILSVLVLMIIIVALILYTIDYDYTIQFFVIYTFSLRDTMLLLINVYYGFRD